MNIGEKIKQRRIELGWSQQKLADKMGYTSKSTITRIEKGYNDVAQKNIAKFADVLGVSIAYLMGWDDEDYDMNITEESANKADSNADSFIKNFTQLQAGQQSLMIELIEALKEEPQDFDKVAIILGKIARALQDS